MMQLISPPLYQFSCVLFSLPINIMQFLLLHFLLPAILFNDQELYVYYIGTVTIKLLKYTYRLFYYLKKIVVQ